MPAVMERATIAEARDPNSRRYEPRGRFWRAWESRDREVIIDGPAGTGKSRMWLERGYQIADKYPGCRGLIVRKTRASLTQSVLVTFEEKVLPPGLQWVENQKREQRNSYKLPNGSEIVCGGMDEPTRLFSTEYDWIYVPEATELTEDEWESLLRALRNGVVPYSQLGGDCNPAGSVHWILQRTRAGRALLVTTRHEDNPEYWDEETGDWTESGRKYIDILDGLTGIRYKRLRLGLWVAAENVIYEHWDPAIHVLDPFPIPTDWARYRSVDFGKAHSFVCQWWAEDPDGVLFLYRELIGVHREWKDWGHEIAALSQYERISATVTDHDVEARADLEVHMGHLVSECGIRGTDGEVVPNKHVSTTTAAVKDVGRGIEAVSNRLKPARDSQPRLYVFSTAVVRRDPILEERKVPIGFTEEIESYVWAEKNTQMAGRMLIDEPMKKDDHSLDACRYLVMYREQDDIAGAFQAAMVRS